MNPIPNDLQTADKKAWHVASRWQEFDGEMRSALLRAALVIVFYAVQLIHYFGLEQVSEAEKGLHRAITFSTVGWLVISMGVFIALRGGFMPAWLKYVVTAVDLLLVTLLAWIGHGAASPLVATYFLIIALAGIRFRIGLIWFTTLGAMIGYLVLVGTTDASWFDRDHQTPVLTQAITLCSLASTGIVVGQMIRSGRSMTRTFANRIGKTDRESAT
jgi:hypothetical protein